MGKIKETISKIKFIKYMLDKIEIRKIKRISDIERVEMLLNENEDPNMVPHIVNNMENTDKAVDAFVEVAGNLEADIIHRSLEKFPLKKRIQILKKHDDVIENLLQEGKMSDIIKYIPQIADEDERYSRIYEISGDIYNLALISIIKNTHFEKHGDKDIANIIAKRIAKDCCDYGNTIHLKELIEMISDENVMREILPLTKKHYDEYVELAKLKKQKRTIKPFEEDTMEEAINRAISKIQEERKNKKTQKVKNNNLVSSNEER